MKLAYMAHPYGGDAQNVTSAKRWLAWLVEQKPAGIVVMAPWIAHAVALAGKTFDTEAEAMAMCKAAVERCDELWCCGGRMSIGMAQEYEWAKQAGVVVRSFLRLGHEPPVHKRWCRSCDWPPTEGKGGDDVSGR